MWSVCRVGRHCSYGSAGHVAVVRPRLNRSAQAPLLKKVEAPARLRQERRTRTTSDALSRSLGDTTNAPGAWIKEG